VFGTYGIKTVKIMFLNLIIKEMSFWKPSESPTESQDFRERSLNATDPCEVFALSRRLTPRKGLKEWKCELCVSIQPNWSTSPDVSIQPNWSTSPDVSIQPNWSTSPDVNF
jgi:hypothetical protein